MKKSATDGPLGVVKTKKGKYTLLSRLSDGTLSRVYAGRSEGGEEVIMKVVVKPEDNTLMLNELGVLGELKAKLLPEVVDSFRTEDGRIATVFKRIDGIDINAIRQSKLHRSGLADPFHLGWLLEHQLGLLGAIHKGMVVHGNIQPQHVLVTPEKHEVRFVDFCFARSHPTSRDRIAAWTETYSAPEIKDGVPPLPGMDIYSVGKVAVFLAGGDPETGDIPQSSQIDPQIRSFIMAMIEPNYLIRPRDAWILAREFLDLRRKVFGDPRWVDFTV